ncbi:MAG: ABC transporter ATP-binding protein [Kiloniellales bacterium]
MTAIELNNVSKKWGPVAAVKDLSFAVDEGSFLVLLGPSGCGKSTTLRMIAGLEASDGGAISIGGQDVTHRPPSKRGVSMVFQSYALFPHLSVEENILFGLNVRKVARAERRRRLEEVAAMVGLSHLLARKPAQLSGGQRQRVALARAIVSHNPICLMDEPLSNLDAKLRHEMRIEIRALQKRLGMTVVYVTHDQAEAMSMADRVVLMREGNIDQIGAPDDLYNTPATMFGASFIGTPPMNLLKTRRSAEGTAIAGAEAHRLLAESARNIVVGVRPEHISLAESGGVPATLAASDYLGADTVVAARIADQEVLVRVAGHATVNAGESVHLVWESDKMHLFDADTGDRVEDAELPGPAAAEKRTRHAADG